MAEYNDIFRPETLAKLNAKSAESARILLGNRDLMRVMMSSQSLLGRIIQAETSYKSRLENLAVSMITEMYPTITQENINIDAKIVSMSDVGRSLDEATPNEPAKRYRQWKNFRHFQSTTKSYSRQDGHHENHCCL
jgi:hypothetical protein